MGIKGGSRAATSSGAMPEWTRTAHTDLLARGKTESKSPYTPYTGERVAGETATSRQGRQGQIALMSGQNPDMNSARSTYQSLRSGTNVNLARGANATQQALGNAAQLDNYAQGGFARFNANAAAQYMSPYQQAVTDIAKRQAVNDYQKANIGRNSDLVSKGAFGGSRQAIIQSEADKALVQQLGDLQTKGSQDAFLNAQQQFGADRSANIDAFRTNAEVDKARIDSQLRGGQQAADIGRTIIDNQMRVGDANAALGRDVYDNQTNAARTVYDMGRDQEARTQAQYEADYSDYLAQRDWSKNQMGWYGGLLTGSTPNFAEQSGEAGSSVAANLLGLGATAIGAMDSGK